MNNYKQLDWHVSLAYKTEIPQCKIWLQAVVHFIWNTDIWNSHDLRTFHSLSVNDQESIIIFVLCSAKVAGTATVGSTSGKHKHGEIWKCLKENVLRIYILVTKFELSSIEKCECNCIYLSPFVLVAADCASLVRSIAREYLHISRKYFCQEICGFIRPTIGHVMK
jgi:hypothetical protein